MPEIAALPNAYIHKPWAAPEAVRLAAGIEMDTHYPAPIVDHAMARRRALNAFARLKSMRSRAQGSRGSHAKCKPGRQTLSLPLREPTDAG